MTSEDTLTDVGRDVTVGDIIDTLTAQAEMDAAAQAEMDRAIQALALLPPEQRAGWVIYFFKRLDSTLGEAVFTDLVGDALLAMGNRLQFGLW